MTEEQWMQNVYSKYNSEVKNTIMTTQDEEDLKIQRIISMNSMQNQNKTAQNSSGKHFIIGAIVGIVGLTILPIFAIVVSFIFGVIANNYRK